MEREGGGGKHSGHTIKSNENKASTKQGRHDGHHANNNGSHGQARDTQASGSTGGGRGGSPTAAAGAAVVATINRGGAGLGGTGGAGALGLAARAGETVTLASTILHVLLGGLRHGGERVRVNLPVLVLLGAFVGATGLVVATVTLRVVGLLKGGLESVKVGEFLEIVTVNLDQTVVAILLGVFVDKTTRVDTGHLGGVQSADLLPLALVGVAAVFGKEEGQTVVLEHVHLLVPARGGEGRGVTPGVVVESEEVATLVVGTAVHVLGHLQTVAVDIGLISLASIQGNKEKKKRTYSRVSNRDGTEIPLTQVLTNVTGDGLDVRGRGGGLVVVDNLVTGEEGQGVLVLGEHLDGSEDVLQVDVVVGLLGLRAVDRVLGGVDVQDEVDARIRQSVHTLIVVLGVVHRINTDGVQTQTLELLNVALAAVGVGDGVGQVTRATGLVVDTADVEALVALEEGVTLDADGGHIIASLEGRGGGSSQGRGDAQGEGGSDGSGLHFLRRVVTIE